MSRTYRRMDRYVQQEAKKQVEQLIQIHDSRWHRRSSRSSPEVGQPYYPGKKAQQRLAQIHGDHGHRWRYINGKDNSKFARGHTQSQHRSQAKVELCKYRKTPEYEVMIPRKNLLPWD